MTEVRFVRFEECDAGNTIWVNVAHIASVEFSGKENRVIINSGFGQDDPWLAVKGTPEEVAAKLMGEGRLVEINKSPDHDTRYMFVFDIKDEAAIEEAFQALLGLVYGDTGVDPNTKDAYLDVLDKAKKWDALQEAQANDPE